MTCVQALVVGTGVGPGELYGLTALKSNPRSEDVESTMSSRSRTATQSLPQTIPGASPVSGQRPATKITRFTARAPSGNFCRPHRCEITLVGYLITHYATRTLHLTLRSTARSCACIQLYIITSALDQHRAPVAWLVDQRIHLILFWATGHPSVLTVLFCDVVLECRPISVRYARLNVRSVVCSESHVLFDL